MKQNDSVIVQINFQIKETLVIKSVLPGHQLDRVLQTAGLVRSKYRIPV